MISPKALLLPLIAALSLSACGKPPTVEREFGEKVRAYLLEHPEVIQEAIGKLQEKEAQKAAVGLKDQIEKNRRALERDGRDFVANPKGKITVVEFFDYNCGYCKLVAPDVLDLIAKNPDVRFVFKDMTIFGPTSEYAAAGAALAKPDGTYLAVHRTLMETKPLQEADVTRILAQHGVDSAAASREKDSPAMKDYLADVHTLAGQLGIEGTPAFVVGDVMIPGADVEALKAAIAAAR